ncbi:sulfhydryl oxidase 1-like [Drosophila pseudoobscura]|uniref:Sulfhydryl oxidase n=1 Tax=Drosophila pseudoobscura pseudoobscura TaxID=46245 RepID=A0A6I8V1J9_DROPS|nr:sulfhydryl oxidase 1 [Drosophila pseudoobscura]
MIRPLKMIETLPVIIWLLILATAKANALPGEPSLYNEADNVINADTDTLLPYLRTTPNGKLVQFLNIFCGHCRRFAPIFKAVARELYKWKRVLSIYAVDCAQARNVEVCRDFQILQTPTLRYFPPAFSGSGIGINIPTLSPTKIIDLLAGHLAKDINTSLLRFEPLTPDNNVNTTLADHKGPGHTEEYIALVVQPKGSNIGRDTILELLPYPAVAVRIVDDARIFSNFGLAPHGQKLAIMDLAGNIHALKTAQESSQAYAADIAEYLAQMGRTPLPPLSTTRAPHISRIRYKEKQQILSTVLRNPHMIYKADVEQAIDILLHIELPKAGLMEGNNLTALRNIISVLRHYNPLNKEGKLLLTGIHDSLIAQKRLTGSEFADLVKSKEKELEEDVFKAKRFVGCTASRPFLRGFTCSLWTLFHYLTVAAAKPPNYLAAGSVLSAMHGFAKHFFGCTDCAQHFLAMAARRHIESVTDHDSEILWLWEAHNEVNNRLAGDTTEDPMFPKIQFPRKKDCPSCKNEKWNQSEVLKYLKNIYDTQNLSDYGYNEL